MKLTQEEIDRIRYVDGKLREVPYHKRVITRAEEEIMEARIRRYGPSAIRWKSKEEAVYQRGTPTYGDMSRLYDAMDREDKLIREAQPHIRALQAYEDWKGYLTEEDRKLIELYYEEQKRQIDIAEALSMDRTTVTRNVKRILRQANPAVFS